MTGTVTITQLRWEKLVDAFRKSPEGYTPAARYAGVTEATARRAWLLGDDGREPIKSIIEAEQKLARVALEATREEVKAEVRAEAAGFKLAAPPKSKLSQSMKDAIRPDAIRARSQEAAMVRLSRGNVIGLSQITSNMLAAAGTLAVKVRAYVEKAEVGRNAKKGEIDLDTAVSLLSKVSGVIRNAAHAGQMVVEMERELLGTSDAEPQGGSQDMSLEAAMAELEAINAEFEAARRGEQEAPLELEAVGQEPSGGTPPASPAVEVNDGTSTPATADALATDSDERTMPDASAADDASAGGDDGDDDDED